MSDILTKEFINELVRRHKRKARRKKRLDAAKPKPEVKGAVGVADDSTPMSG